jgi:hypothetical protein
MQKGNQRVRYTDLNGMTQFGAQFQPIYDLSYSFSGLTTFVYTQGLFIYPKSKKSYWKYTFLGHIIKKCFGTPFDIFNNSMIISNL